MDREPESAAATHFSRASFSSSEPNEPEPVNNEGSGGVSALTLDISNFQPASGSEGSRVVSVRSDISRYGGKSFLIRVVEIVELKVLYLL
jgi:hypothetical protein